VIAVSEWESEQLATDFDVDATVIQNGVDGERFAQAQPIERGRPYLLTVGRLVEYKGVQHVIRAMVELPEYDLLVAGSGPYQEVLMQIARENGVENRVNFLGYVDEEELPGLYAGADVYVTMSEFEAYGMTVAEALAAGTPCVVREVGGLRDWIEIEGVLGLRDISSQAIAQTIKSQTDTQVSSHNPNSWLNVTNQLIQTIYDLE
jgi:glycosyltransferase involved in cell wall biosynthesis